MCDFENSEMSVDSNVIVIRGGTRPSTSTSQVHYNSSGSPYRVVVEGIATMGGQCGEGGCRVLSIVTKV